MKKLIDALPILLLAAFLTAGFSSGFAPGVMRPASLVVIVVLALTLTLLRKSNSVSPISWTMSAYLVLGAVGFWLWPSGLGRAISIYPLPLLYLLLLLIATAPQLFGLEPFTTFFAKRRTPEAVQATDIFRRINLNMSWGWAAIFAASLLISLVPNLIPEISASPVLPYVFNSVLPIALNLGIGLPFTAKYPDYYQRKMGIQPVGDQGQPREEGTMTNEPKQAGGAHLAKNCRELISLMPFAFNAETAGDLKATIQFKVTGDDEFSSYLEIADGKCTHHEGEAAQPDLVIDTPGQVWLDISQGRLAGQEAFMQGLYKVNGELAILMKFNELFKR
jgi:putative sterol carrier protein